MEPPSLEADDGVLDNDMDEQPPETDMFAPAEEPAGEDLFPPAEEPAADDVFPAEPAEEPADDLDDLFGAQVRGQALRCGSPETAAASLG